MENKKGQPGKWLSYVPVLLLCCLLVVMAAVNLPMIYGLLKECVKIGEHGVAVTFDSLIDRIAAAYKSDDLTGKTAFVNVNGLFMRMAGRDEVNGVNRMKNGTLAIYTERHLDMNTKVERLSDYSTMLNELGISFIYVQAPSKMPLNQDLLKPFTEDASNADTDDLVNGLKERGVHILDLRPYLNADQEMNERNFYRTDHHWNASGAFGGFQQTMRYLNTISSAPIDLTYTDSNLWTAHWVPNLFLGSNGKRVGVFYGGVDDLEYYTPNFETEITCIVPYENDLRIGDYETACIREEFITNKDYFRLSNYCVYFGGDKSVMKLRNQKAPNDMKVMVMKDSFGLPFLSFLATEFKEIDVIDARYYTDTTIAEYTYMNRPDLVILLLNPSTNTSNTFYDFETDRLKELMTEEYGTREVYEKAETTLRTDDSQYAYTKIPVKLTDGCIYTLTISEIEMLKGHSDGITVSIYSPSENRFLVRDLWELANGKKNGGGFTWRFMCPVSYEKDDAELRIFGGIIGHTEGKEMVFKSIHLTEEYPIQGKYPVFSAGEAHLAAQDGPYNNVRFDDAKLLPGKVYLLTADAIELTEGNSRSVTVGLYSFSKGKTLYSTEWYLDDERSGCYQWQFIVPQDATSPTDCQAQIFAGKAGSTNGNALKIIHPVIYEVVSPYGEEIFYEDVLSLPPENGSYHFATIPIHWENGRTYTVTARNITCTGGNTSGVTVSLYDNSRQRHVSRTNWFMKDASGDGFSWSFTLPQDAKTAANCQLALYSGWAGETNNIGIDFSGVSVYRWPNSIDGAVVYSQARAEIPAKNENYNCISLPASLLPGRTYQITIRDQNASGNTAKAITVKLRSNAEKRDLSEKTWWINGDKYSFSWIFTVPDSVVNKDDIALQIFAGEQGKTNGIALELYDISIIEIH